MTEHTVLTCQAEKYLRENRIVELMEDLTTAILYHKPDDVNAFILA